MGVVGRYHPTETIDLDVKKDGPELGISMLEGWISQAYDDKFEYVVKGTWTQTSENKGIFEMKLDVQGHATGWWAYESDDPAQNAGNLPDYTNNHVPWSWTSNPKEKAPSLIAQLVHSVYMTRYSVGTAWLFVVITAVQLFMSIEKCAKISCIGAGGLFNAIYALIYATFLYAYRRMRLRPSRAYTWGVILYTVGYMSFCLLSFVDLEFETTEDVVKSILYINGSATFLLGSVLLAWATLPKQWFSCGRTPSLFWGSITFLIGSLAFMVDSLSLKFDENQLIFGMALFFAGRLFFVHGCTTEECGICFADNKTGRRESKRGSLYKKLTMSFDDTMVTKKDWPNYDEPLLVPMDTMPENKVVNGRSDTQYTQGTVGSQIKSSLFTNKTTPGPSVL